MAKPKQKSLVLEIMDVLKEQQALFALMLAYAVAITSALFKWGEITKKWINLNQDSSVWILYTFAFLPVLVPAAVVIVRRWRRTSLERRLADIGPNLTFKYGHFRTAPYSGSEEDRRAYKRTDHAHEEALDHIETAAGNGEPFFFLHSQSGCGKTSLLQAFVIPAVEKQGWRVISLRGYTGIFPELAEALGLAETASFDEIQSALIAEAATRKSAGSMLLVVVDQFEEFLILYPEKTAQLQAVREWFTGLRGDPLPGMLLLLSLRSEYQTLALKLGLPDFDSVRSYVVPLFTAEDARVFLRSGLQTAGKKIGELPLDQFIRQMEDRDDTRGMVRPIQANLVGHAYRTYAAEFHARLLAGKRVDFLADWLHRLFQRRELRLHVRPIFESLLQKDGSRCPARVTEIATEAELDSDLVRHCLSAFEGEGLVRCLSPELPDDRQKLWEISHDFLAVQIKRNFYFWHRLWYESLARAVAPSLIGLWLVAMASFLMQDSIHVRRLADLGFYWNRHRLTASVNTHVMEEMNTETVVKAMPSLRGLGCKGLDLSGCTFLQNADCLKNLPALTSLNLRNCNKLQNFDFIKDLPTLTNLRLEGCEYLRDANVLKSLTALTELKLISCNNLENFDVIKNLPALTDFDISGYARLENLDDLKSLSTVTKLRALSCENLRNIDALKHLPTLTDLDLAGCKNLQNFEVLNELPKLTRLSLSVCDLKNGSVLTRLKTLTKLYLSESPNLEDLDCLKDLANLTYLEVPYCPKLRNIDGIKGLTALREVKLVGCPNLSKNAVDELKAALPKTKVIWDPLAY